MGLVYATPQPTHIDAQNYTPPPLPVVVEEVKDPELTFPGEACNCYLYTKNRVPNLPRMADIYPNADPAVGAVAVEWFSNIKHVSVVTAVEPTGVWVEESNYTHCETGERFIPFSKYSLSGFWTYTGK